MGRPIKCRMIRGVSPTSGYFKPCGISLKGLEEVRLEPDELEALRLADLEQRYQVDAAERMGISRQTFANIICRARYKLADTVINSKALRICHVLTENNSVTLSSHHSEESFK